MLVPPTCFTCGIALGDLASVYEYIAAERMAALHGGAESKVTPPFAVHGSNYSSNMEDVLVALNLTSCCRAHMMSAMDFRAHY